MLLSYPEKAKESDWDVELYCPPGAVSEQERSQMKTRLDGWARDLSVSCLIFLARIVDQRKHQRSSYRLPCLSRPLRPLWITPVHVCLPHAASPGQAEVLPDCLRLCVKASW